MTDDLIDRVARDLTAAPAPDLARAVRARIAATPPFGAVQGQRTWHWRVATGAVVLAAAVIAVLVPRSAPVAPAAIVAVAPPAAPPAVSVPSGADPGMSAASTPPACPEPCRKAARVRPITQVEAEWQSRAIAALVPSAPLTIDPIQPDRLTIPLMQLEPLGTTPIELTPVGSAGGR